MIILVLYMSIHVLTTENICWWIHGLTSEGINILKLFTFWFIILQRLMKNTYNSTLNVACMSADSTVPYSNC